MRREKVVTNYKEEGICQLFEWQAAALAQPGVLDDGANLVYTAPTSGGKTLVAEMLMLHRLEEGGAHAKPVFVVPYKAIVDEKVRHFERVLKGTKTKVAAYYGGRGTLPVPPKLNVLVCTMEKADVVVQNMATEGRLGELVAAVIDEVHEVGGSRGCCVESLLSKLVCFGRKQKQQREAARLEAAAAAAAADGAGPSGVADTRGPQLIAMSATLPNVEVLGEFARVPRTPSVPPPYFDLPAAGTSSKSGRCAPATHAPICATFTAASSGSVVVSLPISDFTSGWASRICRRRSRCHSAGVWVVRGGRTVTVADVAPNRQSSSMWQCVWPLGAQGGGASGGGGGRRVRPPWVSREGWRKIGIPAKLALANA